jgi:hypothetical protein
MKTPVRRVLGLALAAVTLATLTACGGCDDTYLTVKGVAAKGLAIDGGAVTVNCAFGDATAVTAANGSYLISITNGVGPCIVKVTKDGVTYRSITREQSTSIEVANVNPITDAIVQGLIIAKGASNADALVDNAAFTPSKADITAAVQQAVIAVNNALPSDKQIPVNTDLLSGIFTAATSTTPSTDPVDNALDVLVTGTNTTLPPVLVTNITTAVDAVVSPNPTGGTGGTGGTGATGGVN